MSSFREIVSKTIHEQRHKLSTSSLKTYVSTLVNLHKKLANSDENIDWFKTNAKEILEHLHDTPPKQRKSILAALYVLTNESNFRTQMILDCKTVNDDYKNQRMTPSEKTNWVSTADIHIIYNELKSKVDAMFSHKAIPNIQTIVEYFLLAFLGGIEMPPRRSLDYSLLKIRNFNPKEDNYYRSGKLVFNKYKTSGTYGKQVLEVPSDLNKMIKRWIKLNKEDYMLVSSNSHQLSSPQINRLLNKIFGGKKVSTDLLRHIFLTQFYTNIPSFKDMDELAHNMGHSINQALLYIKRD